MTWSNLRRFSLAAAASCGIAVTAQAQDIVIQAEDWASATNWISVADAATAGGAYATFTANVLGTDPTASQTPISYSVAVPDTLTRSLYARILTPDADPDGTTDNAFSHDSAWFGNNYDLAPTTPHINDTTGPAGGANVWGWINITAGTGVSGAGNFQTSNPSYTAGAPGTYDINIAGREIGLQVDAYVLSTNTALTASELDTIAGVPVIPEPSTFALALLGLAGVVGRRGRK